MSEASFLAVVKLSTGGWALDPAWKVLEGFLEEETKLSQRMQVQESLSQGLPWATCREK